MVSSPDDKFFDYFCDETDEPFCERVLLMNMAVGYAEDAFCLKVLGDEHGRSEAEMAAFCWGYIQARDCFRKPWAAFDASACPRVKDGSCYCQRVLEGPVELGTELATDASTKPQGALEGNG